MSLFKLLKALGTPIHIDPNGSIKKAEFTDTGIKITFKDIWQCRNKEEMKGVLKFTEI